MKIIQVTDMHLALDGKETYGVDVCQNFMDILHAIEAEKPELIVLTGDISYDSGNRKVYNWVKNKLDATGIAYEIIAGNHDGPLLLAEVFHKQHRLTNGELYWRSNWKEWPVFFLETSTASVSKQQLDWLKSELQNTKQRSLIFMHHPPITGGVLHMDQKWPLLNREALQEVLFSAPNPITIFCGHYHVEKSLSMRNLHVHITPSTFFQMKWQTEDFQVDNYRIAYREINLRNDGAVDSTVVYLDGNKT